MMPLTWYDLVGISLCTAAVFFLARALDAWPECRQELDRLRENRRRRQAARRK